MRNAFAGAVYELAKQDERVVVLVADISPAGAMEEFKKSFPSRFINVGVAEASMIGVAAGLAQRGFKPFCYSIASFSLFRCYEQIRCDLAYQNLPVTVVGMGAGLSYSTLGGTHQAIEDVAVAMAMPNMTVLAPCDPAETIDCVRWCAGRESGGPVYMRLGKAGEPDLTHILPPWEFGRMRWWSYSATLGDTSIVGYGPIMEAVLDVGDKTDLRSVNIATCPTLTEFHQDDLKRLEGKRLIVVEEAAGAPLASALQRHLFFAAGVESIALPREFRHIHGTRAELLDHYGLTAEKIIEQLR